MNDTDLAAALRAIHREAAAIADTPTLRARVLAIPTERPRSSPRRWGRSIGTTTRLIAAAALALFGGGALFLAAGQSAPPVPIPSAVPSTAPPSVADLFEFPFEYTLPQDKGLVLTRASNQQYGFTEGSSDETYPGSGFDDIPGFRGVTISWGALPTTCRPGSDRYELPLRPGSFLADLAGNPAVTIGPITPTLLAGLPALAADVTGAYANPGYPAIHMDGSSIGTNSRVALEYSGRLIVSPIGAGSLVVHIWAATDEEFAVWLPLAADFVESIRFFRAPIAPGPTP